MGPFAGPGEYGLARETQRHREKALDKKARIADGRRGSSPSTALPWLGLNHQALRPGNPQILKPGAKILL
jgi:hypothetical protein